jgi:hypothetical protein
MKRGSGLRVSRITPEGRADLAAQQARSDADYAEHMQRQRDQQHAAMLAAMGDTIVRERTQRKSLEVEAEREVAVLSQRIAALKSELIAKGRSIDALELNIQRDLALLPETVKRLATDLLLQTGIAEKRAEKTDALVQPEPTILAPASPKKKTAKIKDVIRGKDNRVVKVIERDVDLATADAEVGAS